MPTSPAKSGVSGPVRCRKARRKPCRKAPRSPITPKLHYTSRTPHSVEHRPRQTVLRQRYNLAQSKHAVAYCWRWRRTYFTLREDRLHEAQTEPNYDNACAYRDANGSLFLCTRTPMPSGRTSSGRDELALAHLPHTRQQLCATQLEAPPAR